MLLFPQPPSFTTPSCHKSSTRSTSNSSSTTFTPRNPEHQPFSTDPEGTRLQQNWKPTKTASQKITLEKAVCFNPKDRELKKKPQLRPNSLLRRPSSFGTNSPEIVQRSTSTNLPSSPVQHKNIAWTSARPKPPLKSIYEPKLERSKLIHLNFPSSPTTSTTKISLKPGIHFWQRTSEMDPSRIFWSFDKVEDSEEYKILQNTADPEYNFIVQELRTGEKFDMHLSEKNRLKSDS